MRTHGPGRGTRYTKGNTSGVTFVTVPSGTTINYHNVTGTSATFSSGIDTGYGTALKWTFGTADNENNGADAPVPQSSVTHVLTIATGLTSVVGFYGSYTIASGASLRLGTGTPVTPLWSWAASGGDVTVYTYSALCTPQTTLVNGVSLQWIAFGT